MFIHKSHSKNELVNIKLSLTNRLTEEINNFKNDLSTHNVPAHLFDYQFTDVSKELFQGIKQEHFKVELNCILPPDNIRMRDRVPYFDILNCSMIWDFSTKEFNTKNITESNNYSSDVFNILIRPWEIVFNDRYIKEHFQPNFRNIDILINHPVDLLDLEEELDFVNPEEDIEKLLELNFDGIKDKSSQGSIFVQSSSERTTRLMKVFHKMIPDNVEMVDITMKNRAYKTYSNIAYNEIVIDKLLQRITKYQEKGYIVSKNSNFISVLLTAKLDNVFNIFTNDGMISLLGETIEGISESSQEMVLDKMHETNRDTKKHNDKEFKNIAKNLEVLEFMKETIIKVHELKKNNLFDTNIKPLNHFEEEEGWEV